MTPRVCATPGCTTLLSRYNSEEKCGAHLEADRIRLLEEQAEARRRAAIKAAAHKANPAKSFAVRGANGGPPAPGTIRSRILDAMPGTMPEIAATIDEPRRNVSKYLATLVNEGKATAEGPRGAGPRATRIYRRVERREEAA